MAETTTLCPTRDPKSPYYLNLDERLQYYTTTMTKLSKAEDNYVFWKHRIQDLLRFTNKLGFVDGTIEKPNTCSPLYEPWKQCDAVVKYWLMNAMSNDVLESVMYAETAQKMWENLRVVFVPNVELKIYKLRRSLATIRQNGDSVLNYFGRLDKAWTELAEYDQVPGCKCEIAERAREAREKEQRYAFLMGLNQSFSMVTTRIMVKKNPPSLHEALGMVERAELMMKNTRR